MKSPSVAHVVGIVGIAGAGIACVSLAYESGFAQGVGLKIYDLSLGFEDLTKSAAAWAPPLFVAFLGIFLLEMTTSYIEGGKTEEEILTGTRHPNAWRRFRRPPDYLFLFLGLLLAGAVLQDATIIRPFVHYTIRLR